MLAWISLEVLYWCCVIYQSLHIMWKLQAFKDMPHFQIWLWQIQANTDGPWIWHPLAQGTETAIEFFSEYKKWFLSTIKRPVNVAKVHCHFDDKALIGSWQTRLCLPLRSLLLKCSKKYTLDQACTTYGPRAKCGPPRPYIWPASPRWDWISYV